MLKYNEIEKNATFNISQFAMANFTFVNQIHCRNDMQYQHLECSLVLFSCVNKAPEKLHFCWMH